MLIPMEPSIRYAKAADGTSIAYWELGEGPPLVVMPATPFTHVQLEWRIPDSRRWLEALLPGHRLVRYDARGFGLSDREVSDFRLEAQCLDLDAVVDALGCEQFAVYAQKGGSTPSSPRFHHCLHGLPVELHVA